MRSVADNICGGTDAVHCKLSQERQAIAAVVADAAEYCGPGSARGSRLKHRAAYGAGGVFHKHERRDTDFVYHVRINGSHCFGRYCFEHIISRLFCMIRRRALRRRRL